MRRIITHIITPAYPPHPVDGLPWDGHVHTPEEVERYDRIMLELRAEEEREEAAEAAQQ